MVQVAVFLVVQHPSIEQEESVVGLVNLRSMVQVAVLLVVQDLHQLCAFFSLLCAFCAF